MRTAACVVILAVCLGQTSCSLFGKKSAAKSSTADQGTVPGANVSTPTGRTDSVRTGSDPASPPRDAGILAGQVIDHFNHPIANAYVRILTPKENQAAGGAAPLSITADDHGYFTIPGLLTGRTYNLVAEGQDGGVKLTGQVWVKPPDTRVLIPVSSEWVPPSTPSEKTDQPATAVPGYPGPGPVGGAPRQPTADLGPPSAPSQGQPIVPIRPEGVVANPDSRVMNPPTVQIPSPGVPGWSGRNADDSNRTWPQTPARPQGPAPVPSCVLIGQKLDNLALADSSGRTWEYRRDRRGRLVLLDFWGTWCLACKMATPHLVALHNLYAPHGLEVIGVAYEREGNFRQQVTKVRGVAGRLGIRYRILMAAGETCPVLNQFDVHVYPTLILLDESGRIVWRAEGADRFKELEHEIKRRLGVR